MEAAVRDGDLEPDSAPPGRRLELDLVHRESEVIQPPDPCPDGLPVVGRQLADVVELGPQREVAPAHALGGLEGVVEGVGPLLHHAEIGQPEADVLDEDVEVEQALAVGQARMDLARLGIDEVGLDLVAVAPEERVRERAVAPVDAGPVEIDEQ